jgi:hypothetical protein
MSLKIIYSNAKEEQDDSELVGKILLFEKYTSTSSFFPYFYLGETSQTLNYENWPSLVPYLYDKKLGFFTTINSFYQYKDNFEIYSYNFNSQTKILSLQFTDNATNNILFSGLYEDRELYRMENENSYNNWNRTITPIQDLKNNNINLLFKENNYYIQNFSQSTKIINIFINLSIPSIPNTIVTGQNFEFGLYRIPNKTKFQSVYYSSLKSKTFSITDNINLLPGLRTRSQISGHAHDHTHNMNHTHSMLHTHNLNNHTHGITHVHGYYDSTNDNLTNINVTNGNQFSQNMINSNSISTKTTSDFIGNTGTPNNNITQSYENDSSQPNNQSTSGILSKNINKDNNYSNDINFKVGNRTFSESYVIYAYMYGKTYIPT